MRKIAASDVLIHLDCVQYSKGGFINRNRLPDRRWLTIPVAREHLTEKLIKDVEIADFDGWHKKHSRILKQLYGRSPFYEKGEGLISTIHNAWRMGKNLAAFNWMCIQPMLVALEIEVEQHWQHDLAYKGEDISERIADMVGLVGGSVYLSGPSGLRYLQYEPFKERNIEVRFFDHSGPNPSAVDAMFTKGAI